jgi:hypothetical protein
MHRQTSKDKQWLIVALMGALFLMAGSSVPRAEIPSSTGIINACYDKTNGNLRVTDPSLGQSCRTNELVLTWSQGGTGATLAFGRIAPNGTVTLAQNLSAADITHNEDGPYCFYNIQAKNVMVTLDASGGLGETITPIFAAEIGDSNSNCNSAATAVVYLAKFGVLTEFPFFILFH